MNCYATQTNWTGLGRPGCRRWQHGLRLDQLLSFSGRCEMSVGRTVELLAPPHQTTRVAKLALTGPQAGQPASRQARIYPPDATRWGSPTLERATPLRLVRPWRSEPGCWGRKFQYPMSNFQFSIFKVYHANGIAARQRRLARPFDPRRSISGHQPSTTNHQPSTIHHQPTTNDHCPQPISIAHATDDGGIMP